ncbi:MAG: YraN family protein [Pseudomonadales bacterium]|nr:YraN family protein [Pseudomonadales bacterium]
MFLRRHGLRLIEKNFHCRSGEIDIIMVEQRILVFVEVRYRSSKRFGGAAASVGHKKQQRLIKAADTYLLSKPEFTSWPARFDVVAIDHRNISWLKNAFEC